MIWLLIGYMWLFIHRPFEIWPVLATIRLERIYMIITIVCWCMNRPTIPSGNKLHRYFAMFYAAIVVSWAFSPYAEGGISTIENLFKYSVFYVMLVTSVRSSKDLENIVAGFCGAMFIYMAHTYREYLCGNVWYAQGIMRMKSLGYTFGDYNDCAGLTVSALPMAWVLWRQWKADWKKWLIAIYVSLSAICVYLTASRMGAVGFVAAGMMLAFISPYRWRSVALLMVIGSIGWIISSEEHKDRYLTIIDSNAGNVISQGSAGHLRSGGFTKGLELFSQYPLCGIGPGKSGTATGTGMMLHNMYGQLLAELGLCGAITFGLVVWGCLANVLTARRIALWSEDYDTFAYNTVLAAAASFGLLLFMGWGFNFLFWHVWLWFGGFQIIALQVLKQSAVSEFSELEVELEFHDHRHETVLA